MVRINLNEFVKFIPTEDGVDVLKINPYFTGLEPEPSTGEYRLPLWLFCKLFGPYFENGSSFIKENTVVIGDANEHV